MLRFPLFPSAKELDVKNIVNVLHEAEFADGDWELLGLQLIKHADLTTIKANRHGEASLCMMDIMNNVHVITAEIQLMVYIVKLSPCLCSCPGC